MSVLEKPCPKCKGKGMVPNLILPGRHICRRCEGDCVVITWLGRIAERIAERYGIEEEL